MGEIWKNIIGFEGAYQVSNLGRVKSLDRVVVRSESSQRLAKGKILSLQKDRLGYIYVHLSLNGKGCKKKVHRLVCEAFCEKKANQNVVNHIDGDKTNNISKNLNWCTHQENTLHALAAGLRTDVGENAKDNILSEQEVLDIRNNHIDSYEVLALKYGVSKSSIADIKKFRSWKWLGGDKLLDASIIDGNKLSLEIKLIRKNRKLTLEKFAKELNVSISTVTRWERGKIFPRNGILRMLIDKYDLELDKISK